VTDERTDRQTDRIKTALAELRRAIKTANCTCILAPSLTSPRTHAHTHCMSGSYQVKTVTQIQEMEPTLMTTSSYLHRGNKGTVNTYAFTFTHSFYIYRQATERTT